MEKHKLKRKSGRPAGEIGSDEVAEGLRLLNGPTEELWMCRDCGAEYQSRPGKCVKCGGYTLEKIQRPTGSLKEQEVLVGG